MDVSLNSEVCVLSRRQPTFDPGLFRSLSSQVHVWFANPTLFARATLPSFVVLLSDEERLEQKRFYFECDRQRYLAAHALTRMLLSQYVDLHPCAWRFTRNRYGRPEIAHPDLAGRLRFNLSYAKDLIAIVVASEAECGIDAEHIRNLDDVASLARRFFSCREAAEIETQPSEKLHTRFLEYWTLKEAFVKAKGRGLSIRIDLVEFSIRNDRQIDISISPSLESQDLTWRFELLRPTPTHVVAVATGRGLFAGQTVVPRWVKI